MSSLCADGIPALTAGPDYWITNAGYALPPNTNPYNDQGPHALFSVSFLLWTAKQGGMALAASNVVVPAQLNINEYCCGHAEFTIPTLQSGFRIGLGGFPRHDGWDISLEYTWWHGNNDAVVLIGESNRLAASGLCGSCSPALTCSSGGPLSNIYTNDPCCELRRCCDAVYAPVWAGCGTYDSSRYIFQTLCPAITYDVGHEITRMGTCWDIVYQRLDLDLGKEFYAGNFFSMRPFFGISFAWTDQIFNIQYSGSLVSRAAVGGDFTTFIEELEAIPVCEETFPEGGLGALWSLANMNAYQVSALTAGGGFASATLDPMTRSIENHQQWWGAGIHTGMNHELSLTKDFNLFGHFHVALPWSRWDLCQQILLGGARTCSEDFLPADLLRPSLPASGDGSICGRIPAREDGETPLQHVCFCTKETYNEVLPILALEFGLRWDTWWVDDFWCFSIQAAWEETVLFQHNHMQKILNKDCAAGNLSLQGFTAKVVARF